MRRNNLHGAVLSLVGIFLAGNPWAVTCLLFNPPSAHRRRSGTVLAAATDDPLATPPSPTRPLQVRKRKDLKQFTRYLEVECWKRAELRGLEPVLQAVADACKQINRIVQRAQTDDIYGAAVVLDDQGNPMDDGSTNIQGEVQQKLDVLCNTIMMRAFCGSSRTISGVASEEEDVPQCCADVMVRQTMGVLHFVWSRTMFSWTDLCFVLFRLLTTERPSLCRWRICSFV